MEVWLSYPAGRRALLLARRCAPGFHGAPGASGVLGTSLTEDRLTTSDASAATLAQRHGPYRRRTFERAVHSELIQQTLQSEHTPSSADNSPHYFLGQKSLLVSAADLCLFGARLPCERALHEKPQVASLRLCLPHVLYGKPPASLLAGVPEACQNGLRMVRQSDPGSHQGHACRAPAEQAAPGRARTARRDRAWRAGKSSAGGTSRRKMESLVARSLKGMPTASLHPSARYSRSGFARSCAQGGRTVRQ